jgi:hypothetical protein
MHLFVDISSHGFGHLAITAPILNRLQQNCPHLRLTVRSLLPPDKLHERIAGDFTLLRDSSDFGYVMHDATRVDLTASAAAYRACHADWPQKVASEAALLRSIEPDLVLSNVSYLPLAGAALAGLPAISLCSLNWADLFAHYFSDEDWAPAIHHEILAAYRSARHFLRITPGMPMPDFAHARTIGTIAPSGRHHDLALQGKRAVLVAMGGIRHHLPIDEWPRQPEIRWLVSEHWQCNHPDAIAYESFGLSFTDLLCSVDAIVTKPGYGTFAEAAFNGTPILYQRREDWPEQDDLIVWLEKNNRCAEISEKSLMSGNIAGELAALWQRPAPPRPACTGDAEAAAIILAMLDETGSLKKGA